jgi:hypothetical protein
MHAMKRGARATNIVLTVIMQCTATSTVCTYVVYTWDTSSGNFRLRKKEEKIKFGVCMQQEVPARPSAPMDP